VYRYKLCTAVEMLFHVQTKKPPVQRTCQPL